MLSCNGALRGSAQLQYSASVNAQRAGHAQTRRFRGSGCDSKQLPVRHANAKRVSGPPAPSVRGGVIHGSIPESLEAGLEDQ